MKKAKYLLVPLVFILLISCFQNEEVKTEYRYYDNGSLEMEVYNPIYDTIETILDSLTFESEISEILTGKFRKFYKNSNIKLEGEFKRGEKVGVWKYYNEKGEFIREEEFK